MSSSSVPSGSRKYTLVPRPFAPPLVIGPASTRTPRARWCSSAPSIAPPTRSRGRCSRDRPVFRATIAGRVIAAHGAQKVLGVWGGPGLAGWTQGMTRMGMRPAAFWAWVSAFAELAGGIAFALGLLLPVVAAALTIQMAVAIARAHWSKGFWNGKGGIEFPFTLGTIAAINGFVEPGAYSLDRRSEERRVGKECRSRWS